MVGSKRLLQLIRERCYRTGEVFKLSGGGESTEYVDLRQLTFDPEHLWTVCEELYSELRIEHSEVLDWPMVGPSFGGITLAAGMALLVSGRGWRPRIVVDRLEAKTRGAPTTRFAGLPRDATSVLILEDVITTGASTLKLLEALKAVAPVERAFSVAVVNRVPAEMPIPHMHLFTLKDIR